MDHKINPPALSTLLAGWLRGGISVELSVGLMWLIYSLVLGNGSSGPILQVLGLFAALWTVLLMVGSLFEHTLTIERDDIVVRTWGGALLGRAGRRFPLQRPWLTRGRNGRPGGGLRSTRLWLSDSSGRPHRFVFTLIGHSRLALAVAGISLEHGGSRPW